MNVRQSRRGLDTAYAGTDVCQAQSVVSATSTSVFARRETAEGTDPTKRPAIELTPTLPTTKRSALTSSTSSECIDGGTDDRPLFNILHAGRLRPVSGVAKHSIHWRVALSLVALIFRLIRLARFMIILG